MKRRLVLWLGVLLLVGAYGHLDNNSCETGEECEGENTRCYEGSCQCEPGYTAHPFDSTCVLCPGYGESCWGHCCLTGRGSLQCWQGVCQPCYDIYGNWICSEQINQRILISATQIAMGTALVLGILATFVLMYRLCATTDVRPFSPHAMFGAARLSIGSLQMYIDERLRDAPPRYTRQIPGSAPPIFPIRGYHNAGFIHDDSMPPPPPYSAARKEEAHINQALHI